MLTPGYHETFWLNLTNLGLGLAMVAILLSLLSQAGKEYLAKHRK